VFFGASLGGATVEADNDANYRFYVKTLTVTDIVRGTDVKLSAEGGVPGCCAQQPNRKA